MKAHQEVKPPRIEDAENMLPHEFFEQYAREVKLGKEVIAEGLKIIEVSFSNEKLLPAKKYVFGRSIPTMVL